MGYIFQCRRRDSTPLIQKDDHDAIHHILRGVGQFAVTLFEQDFHELQFLSHRDIADRTLWSGP
jgi:hypothetical protein